MNNPVNDNDLWKGWNSKGIQRGGMYSWRLDFLEVGGLRYSRSRSGFVKNFKNGFRICRSKS